MSESGSKSSTTKYEGPWLHYKQVEEYFISKELPDYAKCALMVGGKLTSIAAAARNLEHGHRANHLPLKPPERSVDSILAQKSKDAQDAARGIRLYYKDQIPEPTRDLILITEGLTGARLVDEHTDEKGKRIVLSECFYDEAGFFLIETYGTDSLGEYMTWIASTKPPRGFESALDASAEFAYN